MTCDIYAIRKGYRIKRESEGDEGGVKENKGEVGCKEVKRVCIDSKVGRETSKKYTNIVCDE